MSHPYFKSLSATCVFTLALTATPTLSTASPAKAQTPSDQGSNRSATLPPVTKQPSSSKASAYYHFALGQMYEELAETYGNRSDYVNQAIDNFRLAMKEDPSAGFLVGDIAELYRMSGRLRDAVQETQEAIKANPDDLNARRVLARIYTQQIGDTQANHVDEGMARRAIEQYKIITDKDPKDLDSLVMLGRLNWVLHNSVDAEAAFKKVIEADPENEDAITGLASVYSERGDAKSASALLEKLTAKSPSPKALAVLASNYEQMHEYTLAVNAYKKALQLDPNRTELKGYLAQDQALAGQYDDALKTYQELADANPQDAAPYLGMAQIYDQQKKFDLALKTNAKAKQIDPDNLEARYQEVQILDDQGKTPEAIAALKSILDSTARKTYNEAERASRAKMLEQLGLLYRQNNQNDLAVDSFRQIAALDPNLAARAEAQVVDTYRMGKDYAKAQQESDAAAAKYPNDRTLRQVRAQLLADQGKTSQAVAELNKLLDGKSDRDVYLAMADVYQKGHDYAAMSKALDSADKLSQTKEEKANILFMRGAMYERQKKYDQAEAAFRQVLQNDPPSDSTYASTLNYLGYMLADQNERLQEAQTLIKRAVDLEPNNYAFLDSLGWVYYHQNRLDEAEQELTRSVQLMGKDPTIHDHLGDVYFKQGKLREAIAQWQASLAAWNSSAPSDVEPDQVAKVQKKLDSAKVKLAKEQAPARSN